MTNIMDIMDITNITNITNSTNGTACSPQEEFSFTARTAISAYVLTITVLGIIFNVFVLMVFGLHKKPCTMPEIYLSNLAVADLILMACLPFWVVNISKGFNWPFGLFLCKAVNLGIYMNTYGSIYFLVLVSVDRYVALVHTMSVNILRQSKHAKLGCLVVWGFSLLMGIPTLTFRKIREKCGLLLCTVVYPDNTQYLLFECSLFIFGFIIPILIISYCTVNIVKALNHRFTERLNGQNNEQKATTLVLAVLLAFFICWLPLHLLNIIEMLEHMKLVKVDLQFSHQIMAYLAFFNSVLNPILYVIVGKNFRKKAREVFQQRLLKTQSLKRNSTRITKTITHEEVRNRVI